MTYKKLIKYIAMMLLGTFSITYVLPTQYIAQAHQNEQLVQIQKKANAKSYEKPKTKTTLGNFTDELYAWYEKLQSDLDAGDLSKLKADGKDVKRILKEIRKNINIELSENEKTLGNLNAKKAKVKHDKFKTELNNNLDNFEVLLDKLDEIVTPLNDLKGNNPADLKEKIEEVGNILKPKQQQQPLGTLPHNNVNVIPPAPPTGEGISAAYMGSTSTVTMGSLPKTPAVEDLAETSEVKFTKEIKELADSLNTTINIYEYVRNNVNFQPYYGSRKGAIGTLQQMSGNDFDQASLLISMLRYKGIPSRYIKGTIEIPIEKVKEWTGTKTPEAAVKIIGSLGIPSVSLMSGGAISAVRMEHVWVEAYIPYENYRGVGTGTGQKIWIPLDPSFKQYETFQGLDINSIVGLNPVEVQNILKQGTQISEEEQTISRVDVSGLSDIFENAEANLEKYISENGLEKVQLEKVFGGKIIISEKLGLLPLTLPYKVTTVIAELREIPKELTETIVFSIKGASPYSLDFSDSEDFSFEARVSELYGKRITLSWAPATSEDEQIINSYGGIFSVPAYLVSMKPQLKVDGVVVAEGNPVGLGYMQQFKMNMKAVGISPESVINPVTVGGLYNIGLDYGSISADEVKEIHKNLEELKSTLNVNNIYTDDKMGEILNAVAKAYFAQLDLYDLLLCGQNKVSSNRLLSEAITGYNVRTKYMFMSPVEINEGSMYIDVDRDVRSVVGIDTSENTEKAYMLSSGMFGSAMEHRIFEQMTGVPSVSTIKIFEEANARGIPIFNIDKENIDEILPKLEVGQSVRTDIVNAVNTGKLVTIPQRNVQYFDWNGVGYIVIQPETGAAGYMISGGVAGGAMSVDEVLDRYVEYVVSGVIGMILWEIVEMIICACLPGGWAIVAIWGLRFVLILSSIKHMVELWEMYNINHDVRYLQEMLIEISAICTLGVIRLGPLKDLFAETASLKGIVAEMRNQGVPSRTTLNFLMTYGVGRAQQATQTIMFFKNYGLTENQLLGISESFDSSTIMAIENAYMKSLIRYSPSDTDVILILFKGVGNSTNAGILSTNIVQLTNQGIVPFTYGAYGIIGNIGIAAAVSAISNGIIPSQMKQLAGYGIETTEYEAKGITSYESAEVVTGAISKIINALRDIKITSKIEKTAEEINAWWRERKYNDPYLANTPVYEITLAEKTKFVRVFPDDGSMAGGWIMKAEDIEGLTPMQIQDKFALPSLPKYVCDAEIPAGSTIRCGIAGRQPTFGGEGGGVQFDLMQQWIGDFINKRLLP